MTTRLTRDCLVSIVYEAADAVWDGDMTPSRIAERAADALIAAGVEVVEDESPEERAERIRSYNEEMLREREYDRQEERGLDHARGIDE